MQITVEFHGVLRRLTGTERATLELDHATMVSDALEAMEHRWPALSEMLPVTACAMGDALIHRGVLLSEGDELILIPPVSGG